MMEVEHEFKIIPLDEHLPAEVQKLSAEGWELLPGIKPIAVYHLVRAKRPIGASAAQAEMPAKVAMSIDDTKVKILRNGQLIDG